MTLNEESAREDFDNCSLLRASVFRENPLNRCAILVSGPVQVCFSERVKGIREQCSPTWITGPTIPDYRDPSDARKKRKNVYRKSQSAGERLLHDEQQRGCARD